MINGKNFFDQPIKNNKVTYEDIRKITTGQGDDYTTGCLLDYIYFKNYCKMITVDLSKQQDADLKAMNKIQMLILKQYNKLQSRKYKIQIIEQKIQVFEFSQGTVKVL